MNTCASCSALSTGFSLSAFVSPTHSFILFRSAPERSQINVLNTIYNNKLYIMQQVC